MVARMNPAWEVAEEAVVNVADQLEHALARTDAENLVRKYFNPSGPFSGPWFDYLDRTAHPANEIGCHDLVAVTMLGEVIPGLLARDLLQNDALRDRLEALLAATPNLELWVAGDNVLDTANAAWELIRTRAHELGVGMADTRTSKLLARKRPNLVPVTDDVVKKCVVLPPGTNYWSAYRAAMQLRPQLVTRLSELHHLLPARLEGPVSLLRVLDALVWMSGSRGSPAEGARA